MCSNLHSGVPFMGIDDWEQELKPLSQKNACFVTQLGYMCIYSSCKYLQEGNGWFEVNKKTWGEYFGKS